MTSTTWTDDQQYCASLSLSGGGWRLATQPEVFSLIGLWPDPALCFASSTQSSNFSCNFYDGQGPSNPTEVVRRVR